MVDYKKRYQAFIDHIRKLEPRELSEYTETHHIQPKCLKGTDDPGNLIKLTLREHFLAHWLLWKIYPSFLPISSAFLQMNNKNPKLEFKGFQGRITSRTYQKLKTDVYDQLKAHTTNKVRVHDENGNIITLTKEEYANQTKYKFHTTGKTYVFDTHSNTWVYITSKEYQENKDRYKSRLSFEDFPHGNKDINLCRYQFLDLETNDILKITKSEARTKNKEYGYKRLKHIQNHSVTCINDAEEKYIVSLDEYHANTHYSIHSHLLKGKLCVLDTTTNQSIQITKEEYNKDRNRYLTATKGKVLAKDKAGNNVLVSKKEFSSGEYVGQTKGLRLVMDQTTNTYIQVSKEEFDNNRARYVGPNKGKVNVINKLTGERKQIPKDQFDKTLYVGLGNKKFLFPCLNKLTNKQKNINIYEWPTVKDHYQILDLDKFDKANKAK